MASEEQSIRTIIHYSCTGPIHRLCGAGPHSSEHIYKTVGTVPSFTKAINVQATDFYF